MKPPKGCSETLCGVTKTGKEVLAVTDSLGSHVMLVANREEGASFISQPIESHRKAVQLGYQVAQEGPKCYDGWREPYTLFELSLQLVHETERKRMETLAAAENWKEWGRMVLLAMLAASVPLLLLWLIKLLERGAA